jgi:hypothetical protein
LELVVAYSLFSGAGLNREEARCRWALLLEKVGQEEKAKVVYEGILKKAKRSHHHYRRSQREWIDLAREGVERLSAA